ncbi:probable periplasmic serine endoprotease DegP-like [Oppia nitens]|uniref:probable periplasmic serine endoprotease DegP-like n=1 Tax=Oppia nitens TaxID=1686743 RepID=UPI0023DCE0C6|nr:probable periplasmic serine endoprotease DegP-like [Oppia nitens]
MQRISLIVFSKRSSSLLFSAILTNHWYQRQQRLISQPSEWCQTLIPYSNAFVRNAQLANNDDKDWVDTVYHKCIESIVKVFKDDRNFQKTEDNDDHDDDSEGSGDGSGGSGSDYDSDDESDNNSGSDTESIDSDDDKENPEFGTGWIVDADAGLILTNYHVVQDAHFARVRLQSHMLGKPLAKQPVNDNTVENYWWTQVVYVEPHLDLALLRLPSINDRRLPNLEIANRDAERGSQVMCIGFANLDNSVSVGLIDYISRYNLWSIGNLYYKDMQWPEKQLYTIVTTTGSTKGFSGGPVLNTTGQVIGVEFDGLYKKCILTRRQDLLAFVERAKNNGHNILNQLVKQREQLYSDKPFIGVCVQYNRSLQTYKIVKYMPYVTDEVRKSLAIDDQIAVINGQAVDKQPENLIDFISGQSVKLEIRNDRKSETKTIETQNMINCCFF